MARCYTYNTERSDLRSHIVARQQAGPLPGVIGYDVAFLHPERPPEVEEQGLFRMFTNASLSLSEVNGCTFLYFERENQMQGRPDEAIVHMEGNASLWTSTQGNPRPALGNDPHIIRLLPGDAIRIPISCHQPHILYNKDGELEILSPSVSAAFAAAKQSRFI